MDKQSCKKFCLQQHRYPTINKPKNLSKVSIVLFDMDGVLVDAISSWKFIHDHYSMNNDASVQAYVKGEIDDAEFIRTDVNMWMKQKDPMTKTKLESLLSKMPLMYGATTDTQPQETHGHLQQKMIHHHLSHLTPHL